MSVEPAAVEQALNFVLITKYWKAASLAILLYDYLLTFQREVELIWKTSWGIGKILFLLTRYSALVGAALIVWLFLAADVSAKTCMHFHAFAGSIATFGLATAEAILFLRTAALYNNNITILLALLSIWASAQITIIVIVVVYIRSVKFDPSPSPFFTGCYQLTGSRLIYGAFVALVVQETVVVVFTLYRVVQTGIPKRHRLIQILYRDSLLYYVYLIVIGVGNVLVMAIGPPALLIMTQMFQSVVHAVLSTRVLLNARGAIHHREATVTDLGSVFTSFLHASVHAPDVQVDWEKPLTKSFDIP